MRIKVFIISLSILALCSCGELANTGNILNGKDDTTIDTPSNPDNPGDDNGSVIESVACSGGLVKHDRYNLCVYPAQIKCTACNPAFPGTTQITNI